jgi:fatty-acyl-CoA synthase
VCVREQNHPSATRLSTPVTCFVAGAAPTPALIKGLDAININVIAVYGLSESYGPQTRLYEQPGWRALGEEEYFRRRARQGQAFANADEVVVLKRDEEGNDVGDGKIEELPWDGKTVGEIGMRGNLGTYLRIVCCVSFFSSFLFVPFADFGFVK